jgi:hypothetical protein
LGGAQQEDGQGQHIPIPRSTDGGQDAGLLFRGDLDYRDAWHNLFRNNRRGKNQEL